MKAKNVSQLVVALGLALAASPRFASAANIISDNFTGLAAQQNWAVFGGACMTAGNGTGSVPACTGISDAAGSGALRLTSAQTYQRGAIISNWTFPSNEGIQVTFTTYTYGGNSYGASDGSTPGADGLGFYLIDGTHAPNIGAFGGSLGYSCSNSNSPHDGIDGGYIGLGIDEYGNFMNAQDNTATGVTYGSQNPNEVAVRGEGSITWKSLNATYPNLYPSSLSSSDQQNAVYNTCATGALWDFSNPGNPQQTNQSVPDYNEMFAKNLPSSQPISDESASKRSQATPITYRLTVTPGGQLNLSYKYGSTATTFQDLITNQSISASNGPMPSSFRFGFGASTGGGTNVHEITCFAVTPANLTIGAPVAPISLSGSSLVYTLDSSTDPIAGHVNAYTTNSSGVPSSSPTWDAASAMTSSDRTGRLFSTDATGTGIVAFGSLDQAAFNLSTSTQTQTQTVTTKVCVKYKTTWWGGTTCTKYKTQTSTVTTTTTSLANQCLGTDVTQAVSNIIGFTQDPSYTWSAMPSTCPSYLGPRQSGWYLGEFSSGDYSILMGPPGNPYELSLSGYAAYASSESTRPTALLFTNNDGFLYSINAQTGAMNWGWMPRDVVSQLQNYTNTPTQGLMDGKFRVIDAVDASGKWATYVIGSAESGQLWYDLKLDANGNPAAVVQLPTMPAGSVYPQRQAPVVADLAGQQVAAFVVNNGSGSTLYEFNVATGTSSSAAIPKNAISGTVSSNLFYDPQSGQLYLGDSAGDIYITSLSGSPATDVGNLTLLGTTKDQQAISYLGYQLSNGMPYVWGASQNGITVFGVGSSGWSALWAADDTSGYLYTTSGWTTSSQVPALQANAVISDMPVLVNGVLVVPAYVPPGSTSAACGGLGDGYYDFYSLNSGHYPANQITDQTTGKYLTGDEYLGQGYAFSPTVSVNSQGLPVFGGTQTTVNPSAPILFSKRGVNTVTQWRQH